MKVGSATAGTQDDWRAEGQSIEAMYAHFSSHVYHRHSHDSYSFGMTETGAQAFACRGGRHVSAVGTVIKIAARPGHERREEHTCGRVLP